MSKVARYVSVAVALAATMGCAESGEEDGAAGLQSSSEEANAGQAQTVGTESTWRHGYSCFLTCDNRTFREHTAEPGAGLDGEPMFVFNGSMSKYTDGNTMTDLYRAWRGPAYYVDGPGWAGGIADNIVLDMVKDRMVPACELGQTIHVAGYSRGAYMAMASYWLTRNRCPSARIGLQVLLDPVDTTIHDFTNDAAGRVLHVRKSGNYVTDGTFNMFTNGYVNYQYTTSQQLLEYPMRHVDMGYDREVSADLAAFLNTEMYGQIGQNALAGFY